MFTGPTPSFYLERSRGSTGLINMPDIKEHVSELQVVKYGVPQGSVLGLMLFNVYCLPLTTLIRKYGVSYHVYADDTQVYVECDKNDSSSAYATLYACINDIKEWLSFNFLLLNDKKTELIEYNSNGLNQNNHLVIGNNCVVLGK